MFGVGAIRQTVIGFWMTPKGTDQGLTLPSRLTRAIDCRGKLVPFAVAAVKLPDTNNDWPSLAHWRSRTVPLICAPHDVSSDPSGFRAARLLRGLLFMRLKLPPTMTLVTFPSPSVRSATVSS